MQVKLTMLLIPALILSISAANAGPLRFIHRAAVKTVKVAKVVATMPEYFLMGYAESIAMWYRYEVK
jgi:hypothetical protein